MWSNSTITEFIEQDEEKEHYLLVRNFHFQCLLLPEDFRSVLLPKDLWSLFLPGDFQSLLLPKDFRSVLLPGDFQSLLLPKDGWETPLLVFTDRLYFAQYFFAHLGFIWQKEKSKINSVDMQKAHGLAQMPKISIKTPFWPKLAQIGEKIARPVSPSSLLFATLEFCPESHHYDIWSKKEPDLLPFPLWRWFRRTHKIWLARMWTTSKHCWKYWFEYWYKYCCIIRYKHCCKYWFKHSCKYWYKYCCKHWFKIVANIDINTVANIDSNIDANIVTYAVSNGGFVTAVRACT